MIELTMHAQIRIKERCGAKGDNITKIANSAYFKGKGIQECEKRIGKYLQAILKHSQGNYIKLWKNNIFIFRDEKLLTVYPIPQKILSSSNKKRRFYENI